MFVFKQLKEVQRFTNHWVTEYDEGRLNESHGKLTPREYLAVN